MLEPIVNEAQENAKPRQLIDQEAEEIKPLNQWFDNPTNRRALWLFIQRYRAGDPDDIIQDVHFKLLRHVTNTRTPVIDATLSGWVYNATHNYCLDMRKMARRRLRRANLSSYDDPREWHAVNSMSAEQDNPHYLLQSRTAVMVISDHVRQMPPRYREALSLRIDGKLNVDIACHMGVTQGTVSALIYKARRNLTHRLTKDAQSAILPGQYYNMAH